KGKIRYYPSDGVGRPAAHDQMDINTSALFVSYQPYFTNDWFALDGSNDYHLLPASEAAGKGFTPPAPTPTNYWYNPYFGNTVQLPGDRNIGAISGASSTTAVNANESMPTSFSLQQNYPNPFNPTTTIQFQLPTESIVTLKVYNLLGQEIRTLVNGDLHAGVHIVSFDASNLSSGIYVYRLQAGEFSQVRRMMLIK
ncbi:MAG TPA: T9SS type A sorting domain-containing protein, partial [Bacteroidota bacterium]|nr:T9SS type A sorting domain-containing protein [Bacteroidota bacterium]